MRQYVLCEDLKYNGQRRRDVPDLASGTLYIDVGDRAVRRKVRHEPEARRLPASSAAAAAAVTVVVAAAAAVALQLGPPGPSAPPP